MEKQIIYRKVFIRSEDDLPKESGIYYIGKKDFEKGLFHFDPNGKGKIQEYDIYYWIEFAEFYLLPVELPDIPTLDEADKLTKETDYAVWATHTDINPINWGDASAFFIEGARWLFNRLTGNG